MSLDFDNGEDKNIWVQQFEESLNNGAGFYFESHTFERLLEYYQEQGKLQLALQVCQGASEQMPFNMDILCAQARILNLLNRHEEALELIDSQILCLHPSESNALVEKAQALIELGQSDEGLSLLYQALESSEDEAEVYYKIGIAHLYIEQFDEAIKHLKEALRQNPIHDMALLELASCLEQEDRDEEALEFYLRYIDEDPYSSNAWYNLGYIYNKMEQPEKAIWAYDYAFLIDDQFSSALFNKGKTHLETEQVQDAIDCFTGVLKIEGPSPEAYTQIAIAYSLVEGHQEQALQFFQTALKEDPECSEAWFGMGCHYLREKNTDKAIKLIKKAIGFQKDHGHYWKALGQAEYLNGQLQKSIEAYEEAVVLSPEEISLWLEWSHVYFEQNDFSSAIEIMQEALDEFPMNARCLYRLAAYLMPSGSPREGLSHFQQAILLNFEQHHEVLVHYPTLLEYPEIQALIKEHQNN